MHIFSLSTIVAFVDVWISEVALSKDLTFGVYQRRACIQKSLSLLYDHSSWHPLSFVHLNDLISLGTHV